MTKIFLVIILLNTLSVLFSQTNPEYKLLTASVRQYEKAEWSIDINETYTKIRLTPEKFHWI